MGVLHATYTGVVRIFGFAAKDLVDILRQPRLLAALGLGPFLILLLFGIGFRNEFPPFSTAVSVPADRGFPEDGETYERELGTAFELRSLVHDPDEALRLVRNQDVEVAMVLDEEAVRRLEAGEPATMQVWYNEIDPQRAGWLRYFASTQSSEINRRLVAAAIQSREPELERLRQSGARAEALLSSPGLPPDPRLDEARQSLQTLNASLSRLEARGPEAALSPIQVEQRNLSPVEPTFAAFYAPAVIALLLQHLAMTMASLSIVRERTLGMTELFRAAPVSPLEMVLGKYLGYSIVSGLIGLALAALLIYGLRVPLVGRLDQFALVLGLMTLASLGLGLAISAVARSETQVVQLGMLVLLASVFFSGSLMPLDQFWQPVRVVSYALPVTYGTSGLQEIMLRGLGANPLSLLGLGLLAALLYVVALVGVQRELRSI